MEYTRRYLMDGLHNLRDLGGYAAVASAVFTQRDWEKWVAEGRFCPGK